jgi:hypothetical protein
MGPFRSVLVEGSRRQVSSVKNEVDALKLMAAYIDLNPVRAGLVAGAEDYRWSGWGAALAGEKEAIAGLCDAVGCGIEKWESRGKVVYGSWVGERPKSESEDEDEEGSPNSNSGLLQRVRAFTAGVAVGTEAFVEEVFRGRRDLFGPKRQHGARPVDGGGGMVSVALCALRDLRSVDRRK